ncbi:MAG TPA: bifunctional oligoribonuclease/PAP phosphatase NrnA [Planctomycetota bacterium]|nr:bifunctional oligoribonuclease/PAP phosphatase NrnA [Planctomycetota bacterium]
MANSWLPPHKLSPASKTMIRKVLAFIRKHDHFLVSGHVRSDGDALGSQLAFHYLLKKLGKTSQVVCDQGALPDYRFLPGSDRVGAGPEDLRKGYSAVFTFDSGSWERLERISAALPRQELTVVNIDHHASNERFGDINWVDPSFSACGEMVWELVRAAGVKPDRNIATCVYTTIVTDTGRFSFSNTTTETHLNAAELLSHGVRPAEIHKALFRQKTKEQLAFLAQVLGRIRLTDDGEVGWIVISKALVESTGFTPGDTQDYIDQVKSIKGVRAAILLKETDEPGKVKVSWRTDPGVDGIALASKWKGGGHPRASGATFRGTIEEAERVIVDETVRFVRGASA